MRSLLLVLLFSFYSVLGLSQGQLQLSITVKNNKGVKLAGVVVKLMEVNSKQVVKQKTNNLGKAIFKLENGKVWSLFINDFDMKKFIKMPESGTATQNITETYDPILANRLARQTTNRSNLKVVVQNIKEDKMPDKGYNLLKIHVVTKRRIPQPNKLVQIVDLKNKMAYRSFSDNQGFARFMLKMNNNYDVDVEDNINCRFVDVGNFPGRMTTVSAFYEPFYGEEKRFGDTIIQDLKGRNDPTSNRAHYTIKVLKGGVITTNEAVHLREIHGTDIYLAYTNDEGVAEFLLPIGKKYMVFFDFEKDVDVVDLSRSYGFVSGSMQLNYRPNPRLAYPEKFVPNTEELFLVEFRNFLKKQYPKPKNLERLIYF